jgi:aldehyde dehydrogenase (NAD+)
MTEEIISYNPATGEELGRVALATAEDYERVVDRAQRTFERWRMLPAPKRGEIVRARSATRYANRKTNWARW